MSGLIAEAEAEAGSRTYQLTEKIGDASIGNIRNQRIEEEGPGHRVQQCFLDLVHLKVLVTDSLLVLADSRHGQHSVLFLQPARVQLVVRHDPEENQT